MADRKISQPRLQARIRRRPIDPKGFPASVQEYALADFGPNLSNIAAKFASKPAGPQVAGELDQGPGASIIPRA